MHQIVAAVIRVRRFNQHLLSIQIIRRLSFQVGIDQDAVYETGRRIEDSIGQA